MQTCPNCGGATLSATIDTQVRSPAGHGRLNANEVHPIVVIGCEECSETIEVLQPDDRCVRVTVEDE